MRANLFSELAHLLDIRILKVFLRKTTIGFDQTPGKIGRSIAHEPFYVVQNSSYLRRSKSRVIEERNKSMNGLLKIDIVLPERIIGINQEVVSHILAFVMGERQTCITARLPSATVRARPGSTTNGERTDGVTSTDEFADVDVTRPNVRRAPTGVPR